MTILSRRCSRGCLAFAIALAFISFDRLHAQQPHPPGTTTDSCTSIISHIDIERHDVFDADAATRAPLRWAMRVANGLHVRTGAGFVQRELLFREGDCFDPLLLAESARLLQARGFLARSEVTSSDDGDGRTRVLVRTWDEWTAQVDVGVSYDAGLKLEKLSFEEKNLLGLGISIQGAHRERLERRTQSFGLATPTLPGRTRASFEWGRSRAGRFFGQGFSRPFAGDVGRFAFLQSVSFASTLFSYSTGVSAPLADGTSPAQLLVPVHSERTTVAAAFRVGKPQASWILGASIGRNAFRVDGPAWFAAAGVYDSGQPVGEPLPSGVARQLSPTDEVRIGLHAGTRRFRYRSYTGLDAVSETQSVALGFAAGGSIYPALGDMGKGTGARVHGKASMAAGPALLLGESTVDARFTASSVRDVLAEAHAITYIPFHAVADQTLFLRLSAAGGWNTDMPFQLTLGGLEGVRAYADHQFPGGRELRGVVEDRIRWTPGGSMDLGATMFADVGRVWPGDVPWGEDSGWRAAVGAGLRLGLPAGTRSALRPDIVFPIGRGSGPPIFRLTYEPNRMGILYNWDMARSRRLAPGLENF